LTPSIDLKNQLAYVLALKTACYMHLQYYSKSWWLVVLPVCCMGFGW